MVSEPAMVGRGGGHDTTRDGSWKADLVTNQHTPYRHPAARPVFGGPIRGLWHLTGGLPPRQFSGDIALVGRLNDGVPARAAVNRSPIAPGALADPTPKPITP